MRRTATRACTVPEDITVFERGWLSANCVLLTGPHGATLVDTGYASDANATQAWLTRALQAQGHTLRRILNTHLHSDHCGGNALLQAHMADLETLVPADNYTAARAWDEEALSFRRTGQHCPRFVADGALQAGDRLTLGSGSWQVLAAPGHDNAMLMLFEPTRRILISADALWPNGIGVIFPEIEGVAGFAPMAQTLSLIEQLQPRLVIPGHGSPFTDVPAALAAARRRLEHFARHPQRHAHFAAKVLVKFRLIEWRRIQRSALHDWAQQIPYLRRLHVLEAADAAGPFHTWLDGIIDALVRAGAATTDSDGWVLDQ
ncbi:hypothetical protein AAV94_07125 [Lampropedia cohaerens]|uniref:Metallo-beta-lactamase domain-containing protein n=1 Tax=Lampropedia cohaerens TaxID=1610491 RepID=A0A0U1PZJ8_9BURK|nr:MBL fold metallo-hydrolase [Lampropedia cohaerens]KKW67943.1 hypothetical protein AAV94_07125 [Lampropedia cohaerens]